jgi:NitT/TauT family transport system permease protein
MSGATLDPSARARRRVGLLDGVLLLLVALAVWHALSIYTQGITITTPLKTLSYAGRLAGTGSFWGHVGATFMALIYAFVISAILGLAMGLVFGVRRFAGDVAEPILAGFYTIPKITLYPVVLLIFGLGISAKVAFGVMHGLVPIVLFTLGAIRGMPPILLRTARSLRLSGAETARLVIIPAVLPDIVNGLRVGFSLSLLGVLIGEMFSSQRGLGFLLVNGLAMHNVPMTTAVTMVVIVFAILANMAMLRLVRLLGHRG